jgi:hypothetical protein
MFRHYSLLAKNKFEKRTTKNYKIGGKTSIEESAINITVL